MMKKIYVAAWFIVALAVLVSIFTGTFNPATLFVYSLIALVLIHALALWTAILQTREMKTE